MAHSIEDLINRQILKWEEEGRTTERESGPPDGGPHRPTLCLSREYGGRGAAIGRIVADRLGFQLYSRELVERISQQTHVRRLVIESVDEHHQSQIDEMIASQLATEYFSNSEYLRNLSQVVLTIARHGRAVIVGRGAQFILRPERTLRVRAFAPPEVRIARIAERDRISRDEARAVVLRHDAERNAFCRQHFNADPSDPHHYDLLLNTGTLSVETCADGVVGAFRARFPA